MIRKAYVETDRGQLHYRHAGVGDPVVLLQTLPLASFYFEALMTEMAARGFACYAIEAMGYGRSDPRSGEWQVADYAANYEQAFDRLGLNGCNVLSGHFTGMIATELALRTPGRIGRLVIDGVYAFSPEWVAERLALSKPPTPWTADGANLVEHWKYLLALLQRLDPELEINAASEKRLSEAFFAYVTIVYGFGQSSPMFSYDLERGLKSLRTPLMIIGSPTDTAKKWHDRARAWVPNAVEHVFETVNPLFQLNRPDRAADYATVLERFFRTPA